MTPDFEEPRVGRVRVCKDSFTERSWLVLQAAMTNRGTLYWEVLCYSISHGEAWKWLDKSGLLEKKEAKV